MYEIQNTEALNAVRDQAGLSLASGFPKQLMNSVQPVLDITPATNRKLKTWASATSSSGGLTPYTGVAKKQLYIYGVSISFVKDVTCDAATGAFQATFTQDGVTRTLAALPLLTLTAQQMVFDMVFPQPIVADVGTNITGTVSYTAGSMRRQVTVYGYELEIQ